MATKPELLPEWASEENEDVTGQSNVLEPPSIKKKRGWDYHEFPVRNWMNWMFRNIWEWLKFFKAEQERRIVVHGSSVTLTMRNQLIMVYAVPLFNPSVEGYVGFGYISTDPDPQIQLNTIVMGGEVGDVTTDGATIEVAFTGGSPGTDYEDMILVVEQLGGPLASP